MELESISAEMQREESEISREVRETQRVGIGKSGHVESDNLGKGTERVNAVLRLCRGLGNAQSFFLNPRILWFLCLWLGWLGLW